MKAISILYYAIALFVPILVFVVFTDNTNEQYPVRVYALCISLFIIAGWLSMAGFVMKAKLKWVALSAVIGLAEALALIYLV